MVDIAFKSKSLHYVGDPEFEQQITEYVKSLGASTDGIAYNLRKREHIALVEQYVEDIKRKKSS